MPIILFVQNIIFFKNTHIDRFYSFLFREELHIIVSKYKYKGPASFQLSNISITNKRLSFLTIKQCINQINHYDLLKKKNILSFKIFLINKRNINDNFISVLTQFIFILLFDNYILNLKTYDFNSINSNLKMFEINIATHSNFLFLEQRFQNYDCIIQGQINYSIHIQALLRIIRKYIKDVCILDMLKSILIFLYTKSNLKKHNKLISYYSYLIEIKITNIINLQIDNFLFLNFVYLQYNLKKKSQFQTHIVCLNKWQTNEFKDIIFLKNKDYSLNNISINKVLLYIIHYLRYESCLSLTMKGSYLLTILIYRRLLRFCYRRINIVLNYQKIYKNIFFDNDFQYSFFCFQNHTRQTKVEILGYSLFLFQNFFISTPYIFIKTNSFIESLCLYELCTHQGYPLIKLSWLSLNDSQIISQFQTLYENLLFYYSGINNNKNINFLYYILNDSCLKTLAAKHKTNINYIIYIYQNKTSILNIQESFEYNRKLLNPVYSIIKYRAWSMDMTHKGLLDLQ